ncbi:HWE histidine kinase domain-containing protein [Sphingomicrobium sp. XHP0235]|uniref:sensor histidine kinase n=1 Tax=Sphingomicrobium aquimarinum TaxID=3133971 RepID=UPI0031FE7B8C
MDQETIRTDARLRALINQLVAFVAVLDLEGRLRSTDDAALRIAGLQLGDVWNEPFWETFWWNYDPAVSDQMREDIENARRGLATRRETVAQIAGGATLPVLLHVGPIFDEAGEVVEIVASGSDISTQKAHEAALEFERGRLELLNRELRHRVRNLFAVVQAGLSISARKTASKDEMLQDAQARISALASSHMKGVEHVEDKSLPLSTLVRSVLEPHDPLDERLTIEGAPLHVSDRAITPLTLILHELAMNAAKHGAWSGEEGRVSVNWSSTTVHEGEAQRVTAHLRWTEEGPEGQGLDVPPDQEFTFSRNLIERCASQLGGHVKWNDDSGRCDVTLVFDVGKE